MQADFPERLRKRGLFTYGVVKVGDLCRHQVYDTYTEDDEYYAVKLIQSWNRSLFRYDLNIINYFIWHPFPDESYVYRDLWYDDEGIAIKMDARAGTLRNHIRGDIQLSESEWYQIMYGIAARLVHVHGQNIVHGDLKPSNVLIDLDADNAFVWQGIHVSDFGIQYLSRVGNGFVAGTLSYLAPEGLKNEPPALPTPQSDIWALGCIGYEMCIAQQLSHGRNREPINTFIAGEPLDLSHLDSRFSDQVKHIIEKCLQREPTDRFTALQLSDYIENL